LISGRVTTDGVPTIALQVAGQTYQATIDTGFNGDLELPESLREVVNPRWVFEAIFNLAAGIAVREDVYQVDFPFDGQVVDAEATFVDGDQILIGTKLLRQYRLTMNFVKRTVRLQRLV
jgi:predicted aspartyl protease